MPGFRARDGLGNLSMHVQVWLQLVQACIVSERGCISQKGCCEFYVNAHVYQISTAVNSRVVLENARVQHLAPAQVLRSC
jgi:hypothetical protein